MKKFSLEDFSVNNKENELISSLCSEKEINISISYASDFKSAKLLREIVDGLCKGFGVDPKWRTRLVLIIDELNNNAIEYGSLKGEINHMNFKLTQSSAEELLIEASVVDTGKGPAAKKSKDMNELRKKNENKDFSDHHSIRGRGLFLIISHLVDELYFQDSKQGGLIVGARKTLVKADQR